MKINGHVNGDEIFDHLLLAVFARSVEARFTKLRGKETTLISNNIELIILRSEKKAISSKYTL